MDAQVVEVTEQAFIFFFSGFAFGVVVRVLKQTFEKI